MANLKRVAEWRGKFCLKAANQKSRKGDFAGKPSKLLKEFRRPYNVGPALYVKIFCQEVSGYLEENFPDQPLGDPLCLRL